MEGEARFILELHVNDIQLLYQLQSFFGGVSTVRISSTRKVARYTIVGIEDLIKILLPHLGKYPLQSVKSIDYKFWRNCIIIMANEGHITRQGIEEIISNKAAMNKGISDKFKSAFPNRTVINRPTYVPSTEMLNPNWICGFITGDGSFNITINSKNQVSLKLSIGLHQRERLLLEKIQQYFSLGSIYEYGNNVDWVVFRIDQLLAIRSHFNNYSLGGLKAYNYKIWEQVLNLIKLELHLTPEGLSEIKLLKQQSNKWN